MMWVVVLAHTPQNKTQAQRGKQALKSVLVSFSYDISPYQIKSATTEVVAPKNANPNCRYTIQKHKEVIPYFPKGIDAFAKIKWER